MFLIDALGALVSALFLGVVLVHYQALIGMPVKVLYILALIPCLFLIYDLLCYSFVKNNWPPYLKTIAIANLGYCDVSIILVIYHFKKLTALGIGYFALEIILIVLISVIELRVVAQAAKTKSF